MRKWEDSQSLRQGDREKRRAGVGQAPTSRFAVSLLRQNRRSAAAPPPSQQPLTGIDHITASFSHGGRFVQYNIFEVTAKYKPPIMAIGEIRVSSYFKRLIVLGISTSFSLFLYTSRVEDREDGASNDADIGSDICFEDSGTDTTIVPHRHVFGFEKTLVVSFLDEAKDKERPSQIAYFPDIRSQVKLDVDLLTDLELKGSFSLSHGSGKVLHVVVFAEGAAVREARAEGADLVDHMFE
ncbi:hypothetical protein L2E82_02094 [Cichorium intybus]|uniref:Uncharacterized protein n=1 Tax=Cichorium intybus TaxID=13427 RepID=A0ACB9H1V6_CICIN|nr:hypothetical protein L2E82_02094 [Cichorium intybus]